jgi:proline iminopeptidase
MRHARQPRPPADALHGHGGFAATPAGPVWHETDGAGEPVVLVPGGPGVSHVHYHPWFSRLADRHRVVFFDQPGTGRSGRLAAPDHTIERYVAAIEGVRVHLGAERLALVGLSFGGMPAIAYAVRHPERVRRLVLSNAQLSAATWQASNIDNVNHELRERHPEIWRELLALRARGIRSSDDRYGALLARVLPELEWASPERAPALARPRDPHDEFVPAAYVGLVGDDHEWSVTGTLAGFDPTPAMASLALPVLVLTGRHDRVTTPAVAWVIADALPRSAVELHVFERSGHRPWAEEPEAYFDRVGCFLA